ncbi:MAG: hypothetical protein WAN43_02275 [Rhodomicrobium sp.]|jgi:hypothetical protein
MLKYPKSELALIDLESLFPPQDDLVSGKAEEALQSHMIMGFEEAVDLGMSPMEALSQVLGWVASEMVRINAAGQTPGAVCSGSGQGG